LSKHILDFNYFHNFYLIGINTSCKAHYLAYWLNHNLKINLVREEIDFYALHKNYEIKVPYFKYQDQYLRIDYTLFKNKVNANLLLPEAKNIDYLLKLDGNYSEVEEKLIKQIKSIQEIILAVNIPLENLKEPDILITD